MGVDDDADCVEHVWGLGGIHLSLARGVERTERCTRCDAVRYVTDDVRNDPRRPPLRGNRRHRPG